MIRNEKAWSLLKEDEQLALSLKLGHNKSTWEAGEIMKKAHYKFLEIETRAEFFLKMFTEHLELYQYVIPSYIPMDDRIRQYLSYTIEGRMKPHEAIKKIDDTTFSITSVREGLLVRDLSKLTRSRTLVNKNFALMVFDFDRWNNFRILPNSIQEPSAFKRRNKNADKRKVKNLLTINTYTIESIIKRYSVTKTKDILYLPIFSEFVEISDSVIKVNNREKVINELSKVGFYMFARKERAQAFFNLMYSYNIEEEKHCTEGQKFWPIFRQTIKHSINYNKIQKVIPNRKFLASALKDMDLGIIYPKNTDTLKKKKKKKRLKK